MLNYLRKPGRTVKWAMIDLYLKYKLDRLKVSIAISRADIEISIMEKRWPLTPR